MTSRSKSTSRWGSFIQQAVAGVESRLDTILADDDLTSTQNATIHKTNDLSTVDALSCVNTEIESSRGKTSYQKSTKRQPTRLQERLANAVINSNSRSSQDWHGRHSSKGSLLENDDNRGLDINGEDGASPLCGNAEILNVAPELGVQMSDYSDEHGFFNGQGPGKELQGVPGHGHAIQSPASYTDIHTSNTQVEQNGSDDLDNDALQQSKFQLTALEQLRKQDAIDFTEQIESLQAKLQYLTSETLANARREAEGAELGSVVERLARKDEKIALLLEEGRALAQNELRLSNILKKLRATAADDEKQIKRLRTIISQHEDSNSVIRAELREAGVKCEQESARVAELKRELEMTVRDLEVKTSEIKQLDMQLSNEARQNLEKQVSGCAIELQAAKKSTVVLKEEITTLMIEKKLSDDRLHGQIENLKNQLLFEKDQANATTLNLRNEIKLLEGRLENYRVRAEEVSVAGRGEVQAKLFRQMETLQGQYAIASDNWRTIESTLLARVATLEHDRDELNRKESELRRKIRETLHKNRRLAEDADDKAQQVAKQREQLKGEFKRAQNMQAALDKAVKETNSMKEEIEELRKYQQNMQSNIETQDNDIEISSTTLGTYSLFRPSSRSAFDRSSTEKLAWPGRRTLGSPGLGINSEVNSLDRPNSRKVSLQSGKNNATICRVDSSMYGSMSSSAWSPSGTASVRTELREDGFDSTAAPATPDEAINDMFSASTATAGPSVQLVERMSAAVRRLESEKASSREETDRLILQRNEAREQIVSLMSEMQENRMVGAELASLKAENKALQERYQTTLEMLGERSEKVEELKADIADMKQIYKDVLEKTV